MRLRQWRAIYSLYQLDRAEQIISVEIEVVLVDYMSALEKERLVLSKRENLGADFLENTISIVKIYITLHTPIASYRAVLCNFSESAFRGNNLCERLKEE
jgi:hypothetical protein